MKYYQYELRKYKFIIKLQIKNNILKAQWMQWKAQKKRIMNDKGAGFRHAEALAATASSVLSYYTVQNQEILLNLATRQAHCIVTLAKHWSLQSRQISRSEDYHIATEIKQSKIVHDHEQGDQAGIVHDNLVILIPCIWLCFLCNTAHQPAVNEPIYD